MRYLQTGTDNLLTLELWLGDHEQSIWGWISTGALETTVRHDVPEMIGAKVRGDTYIDVPIFIWEENTCQKQPLEYKTLFPVRVAREDEITRQAIIGLDILAKGTLTVETGKYWFSW